MIGKLLPYDDANPKSIEEYSTKLIGKTFDDVLFEYFGEGLVYEETKAYYSNPRGKGSLGNLIEKYFFLYEPNSDSEPDFPDAGVELKVTPIENKKDGTFRAGERLVIGMIPNDRPVPESIYESHVLEKLRLILFVLYLRVKEENRIDHEIKISKLFSVLSEVVQEDFKIIESDYNLIVEKIEEGKAHELSEGDTMYLGACTKGATAKRSLQSQFYNPEVKAKRRAFSLKQGYMTYVINKYMLGDVTTYEQIIEDESVSAEEFEAIVLNKIAQYVGKTESELRDEFNLMESKSKDIFSLLSFAMLGIKSNNAEELIKSDTIVKATRIEQNGALRESMSFPAIKFSEFAEEEWEDSYIYEYFSSKRFLLVVYRHNGKGYALEGAGFWHMPMSDLEGKGRREWEGVQGIVKQGVEFDIGKNRVKNNFPKYSETEIFHVRPHAKKSAYLINGKQYGNGVLERDADMLLNGDMMTRQSFWLNKKYILAQLDSVMASR